MTSHSHQQFVLVTGATGFIGAHVVDVLLSRGMRVRGATRTLAKGEEMMSARQQYNGMLEFVQIEDFEKPTSLGEAVAGVDAIIHVASPFTYDTTDNERELIIPAINGVNSILEAASKVPRIKRVVLTSSFAAVVDIERKGPPYFVYTADDWNPLSYKEASAPETSAVVAYRGSKKFAEQAAWDFVKRRQPSFDLVTLCPPMTFGPVVHPVHSVSALNETNAMLWRVATGTSPLPNVLVPFWIDVRDLARVHVEALMKPDAGGKRYTPASPEHFSYTLAGTIMREEFPEIAHLIDVGDQVVDESHGLDGETTARELGCSYRTFRETIRDFMRQALQMPLMHRSNSQ